MRFYANPDINFYYETLPCSENKPSADWSSSRKYKRGILINFRHIRGAKKEKITEDQVKPKNFECSNKKNGASLPFDKSMKELKHLIARDPTKCPGNEGENKGKRKGKKKGKRKGKGKGKGKGKDTGTDTDTGKGKGKGDDNGNKTGAASDDGNVGRKNKRKSGVCGDTYPKWLRDFQCGPNIPYKSCKVGTGITPPLNCCQQNPCNSSCYPYCDTSECKISSNPYSCYPC